MIKQKDVENFMDGSPKQRGIIKETENRKGHLHSESGTYSEERWFGEFDTFGI